MKKKIIYVLFFLVLGESYATSPKIIIKLDDLIALNGQCTGVSTMNYLISEQVKFTYGVIANRIDYSSYKTLSPYIDAVDSNGDNLLEIWHHGFDHVIPEFRDKTYMYQKQHFEDADKRINELLNIQMHTFGAPGNATDSITPLVLSENPNYKIFMLGYGYSQNYNGLQHLMQRVEMENGTGNVNFDYFLANYTKYKNIYKDYMIFQGHPQYWDDKLDEFKKIIEYLRKDSCEFVLPYDDYCVQNLNPPSRLAGLIDQGNTTVKLELVDVNDLSTDYSIQRSDDSISWKSIGRVYSNKNVQKSQNVTLTYNDLSPSFRYGVQYYRAKLNNGINGNFSNIIALKEYTPVLNQKTGYKIRIYPNPSTSIVNIECPVLKNGLIEGKLYDVAGNEIMQIFKEVHDIGTIKKTVNIGTHKSGVYILKVHQADGYSCYNKIIIDN